MKKKLVVLLSLILVMCGLLCACGSNSEYVEVGGERYEVEEFYLMLMDSDFKQSEFKGQDVTIVGHPNHIEQAGLYNGVYTNSSCGVVGGNYKAVMIDDSYDEVFANLGSDDLVKIQGTLGVDSMTITISNATIEIVK